MTGDIYLGKILGIPFRLHWSWFLAVVLIVWSLSLTFFPTTLPQYHGDLAVYWGLGLLAALGLFASVILHEMGHAVVARRFGIGVRGIRLFVFGGIAELSSDPKKPSHEILVAVAGPAVTVFLIVIFRLALGVIVSTSGISWQVEGGAMRLQGGSPLQAGSAALLFYLAFINIFLLLFNIVPAFPLDGGRVLRGIVWAITGNYLSATRIAGTVGIAFSYVLFMGGFFLAMGGDLMGGLWLFFLGMFLQSAAQSSIAYAQLQQLLSGLTVADMMNPKPIVIDARRSLGEAVDGYFLRNPYKAYPVIEDGQFIGMLTLRAVQQTDRDVWDITSVRDLLSRQEPVPVLSPRDPAMRALRTLAECGESRLAVIDNHSLVGMLSMRDIMDEVEIRAGLAPNDQPLSRPASEEEASSRRNEVELSSSRGA